MEISPNYNILLEVIMKRSGARRPVFDLARRVMDNKTGESVYELKSNGKRIKPVNYEDIDEPTLLPSNIGIAMRMPIVLGGLWILADGLSGLSQPPPWDLMTIIFKSGFGLVLFLLGVIINRIMAVPKNLVRLYSPHPNVYVPARFLETGSKYTLEVPKTDDKGNVINGEDGKPIFELIEYKVPIIAPMDETDNMWVMQRQQKNILRYQTKSTLEQLAPIGTLILLVVAFLVVLWFSNNIIVESIKQSQTISGQLAQAIEVFTKALNQVGGSMANRPAV